MDSKKFWELLLANLDIPFNVEDVDIIDSNTGTTWVELKNGDVYYLSFEKAEA